jgi:hypothetical protein
MEERKEEEFASNKKQLYLESKFNNTIQNTIVYDFSN